MGLGGDPAKRDFGLLNKLHPYATPLFQKQFRKRILFIPSSIFSEDMGQPVSFFLIKNVKRLNYN
jgi:hypothetical protein